MKRAETIREEIQAKLRARAKVEAPTTPAPIYDELYLQGMNWLDSLAGEPIVAESGVLTIAASPTW